VPDGRRLGHVYVICVHSNHMCRWERGKKGGNGDWVAGPKIGQLTVSMGPARGRDSKLRTKSHYSK
jgi:hypothetical protein